MNVIKCMSLFLAQNMLYVRDPAATNTLPF